MTVTKMEDVDSIIGEDTGHKMKWNNIHYHEQVFACSV